MPLSISKKGGGSKKVSFQTGVKDFMNKKNPRTGKNYTKLEASKIMGKIQKVQDKPKKKR